jgi:Polyketide cyclase / dehydrase and lipid transport
VAARYHFISSFSLSSDRDTVWDALTSVEDWPTWWSWLKRIDVIRESASADGVGAIYRNQVRAPAGYGMAYDTEIGGIDPKRRIDVISSGDIVGRGRFLVSDGGSDGTEVSFLWLVETPKRWMNLLAPIARPAFTWNHDKLMTAFGEGLAATTRGTLTSVENVALRPGSPGFYEMPADA